MRTGWTDLAPRTQIPANAFTTRARALAGFRKAVEWVEGAAMDLLALAALAHTRGDTWSESPALTLGAVKANWGELSRATGFDVYPPRASR